MFARSFVFEGMTALITVGHWTDFIACDVVTHVNDPMYVEHFVDACIAYISIVEMTWT